MIKRGDRVKVTARVAAAFNNKRRPGKLDWTDRRGLVERITTKKANAIVLWDGWQSVEDVPIRSIELEPSSTDDEPKPRRRAHLALACLVCRPVRFGDLGDISAMIEDISQDHPDRMRIVNSLNVEQCPDCDAYGFDYKRASASAGTSSARSATRGSTSCRTRRKCFSCSALAAGHAREPRLSRRHRVAGRLSLTKESRSCAAMIGERQLTEASIRGRCWPHPS